VRPRVALRKPARVSWFATLHEVRARNAVDLGGFLDGDQAIASGRRIHQDTKGVVREIGQSHQ
jgi:hypothetical protein